MSERTPKRQLRVKGEKRPADPTVSAAIGSRLRAVYDEVLTEPVPKELADLVARLSSGQSGGDQGEGGVP